MRRSLLISSLLAAVSPVAAQDAGGNAAPGPGCTTAAMSEVAFAGKELRARVDKVARKLSWNETLNAAAATARELERPIVWVQALGDVNGFA